jgi:hypothetical protein
MLAICTGRSWPHECAAICCICAIQCRKCADAGYPSIVYSEAWFKRHEQLHEILENETASDPSIEYASTALIRQRRYKRKHQPPLAIVPDDRLKKVVAVNHNGGSGEGSDDDFFVMLK